MTLLSRMAYLIFASIITFAMISQWDARAEQSDHDADNAVAESAAPSGELNRVRKWLGRSPRGMPGNQVGKNHDLVRRAFRDCVSFANQSTVSMISNGKQVALGTVVRADGLVLTKASELRTPIRCRIPGNGVVNANQVAVDKSLDLALVKIEAADLSPVQLDSVVTGPTVGSWVATPGGFASDPLVIGVVSGEPRSIERDAPVIGVSIEGTSAGVVIRQVMPGSGAEAEGLEEGDVVTQINNVIVNTPDDLMRVVSRSRPGTKVALRIRRDGQLLTYRPKLGRKTNLGMAEQGLQAHEGGPLSQRRSNFPSAIQHDCLIEPHQCGGPLVDISGRVIGINIARAGRAVSYSLPLATVSTAFQDLVTEANLGG